MKLIGVTSYYFPREVLRSSSLIHLCIITIHTAFQESYGQRPLPTASHESYEHNKHSISLPETDIMHHHLLSHHIHSQFNQSQHNIPYMNSINNNKYYTINQQNFIKIIPQHFMFNHKTIYTNIQLL